MGTVGAFLPLMLPSSSEVAFAATPRQSAALSVPAARRYRRSSLRLLANYIWQQTGTHAEKRMGPIKLIKMLKESNLQCPSAASSSARSRKSNQVGKPAETGSMRLIYVLRQIKSLSAYWKAASPMMADAACVGSACLLISGPGR